MVEKDLKFRAKPTDVSELNLPRRMELRTMISWRTRGQRLRCEYVVADIATSARYGEVDNVDKTY